MTAPTVPVFDIPRDRWGRPLIVPEGGGKPVPYTRVTTLAKALDDTTALTDWKMRQVAVGLTRRPDLAALVHSGPDKKELNRIVQQALDAASSDAAANIGTALHSFAEAVDTGATIDTVPPGYQPHITAYQEAMRDAGVTVLACERFVVCDELQVAGTFDRLLLLPDGRIVVGDLKTGSSTPRYALATAAQVAIYARGQLYNPDTGARTPLPGVDTSTGVLIHLPQDNPICELHTLDLDEGWLAALLAFDVRRMRKANPATPWGASWGGDAPDWTSAR